MTPRCPASTTAAPTVAPRGRPTAAQATPRCPASTTAARTAGPTRRGDERRPDDPARDAPTGAPRAGVLVGVARDEFADQHWGHRPLLTPAAERPTAEPVFGPEAVDELLARRALRTPFLRMAKGGRTLEPSSYTLGGGVGATLGDQVSEDKVLRLFADGATIVLQALHRTWAPVVEAAQDLAADLGHPVQVNAYVTPPQNQGFDDHYDVHDVFVVQVSGEKHWRVRPPVLESPLRDQPWTDRRDAVRTAALEPPVVDAVLTPGDCLYVPRGWLHSATALGGTSIHLTIGVHVWTRRQLADDLLRAAGRRLDAEPEVRASLPLGVDPLDPATTAGMRADGPSRRRGRRRGRDRRRAGAGLRRPRPCRPAGGAARRARPAHGIRQAGDVVAAAAAPGGSVEEGARRVRHSRHAGGPRRRARRSSGRRHRRAGRAATRRRAATRGGAVAVPRRGARARRRGRLRGRGRVADRER